MPSGRQTVIVFALLEMSGRLLGLAVEVVPAKAKAVSVLLRMSATTTVQPDPRCRRGEHEVAVDVPWYGRGRARRVIAQGTAMSMSRGLTAGVIRTSPSAATV